MAGRRLFFRRRKTCPFSGADAPKIDYKDVKLLQRFVSERGKNRSEPYHCGFGQEAARTGESHQTCTLPGAAALRRPSLRQSARDPFEVSGRE